MPISPPNRSINSRQSWSKCRLSLQQMGWGGVRGQTSGQADRLRHFMGQRTWSCLISNGTDGRPADPLDLAQGDAAEQTSRLNGTGLLLRLVSLQVVGRAGAETPHTVGAAQRGPEATASPFAEAERSHTRLGKKWVPGPLMCPPPPLVMSWKLPCGWVPEHNSRPQLC